jgi:hypothetical protein
MYLCTAARRTSDNSTPSQRAISFSCFQVSSGKRTLTALVAKLNFLPLLETFENGLVLPLALP